MYFQTVSVYQCIMSFEFSQNLLTEIQSSHQSQSCISATQTQPSLSSPNGSTGLQSKNIFASVPLTQHSMHPSRPKFSRPQSSLSQQQLPPNVASPRFTQVTPPLNISLANSLKQVQRRLDEFPVQVAKMLEEGFDYLMTDSKKHSIESKQSSAEVCQVLEKIQVVIREKDERVKEALEECATELKNYAEEIKSQKLVQEKYEEAIQITKEIIYKQAIEIDHLKKEVDQTVNMNNQSLKVKGDLSDSEPLLIGKQKSSPLPFNHPPSAKLLPRAFTSLSQSSSSVSSLGCVSQFPQLADLMQGSDSEADMEDSSPGLGVDLSDLITISDSEEEE